MERWENGRTGKSGHCLPLRSGATCHILHFAPVTSNAIWLVTHHHFMSTSEVSAQEIEEAASPPVQSTQTGEGAT